MSGQSYILLKNVSVYYYSMEHLYHCITMKTKSIHKVQNSILFSTKFAKEQQRVILLHQKTVPLVHTTDQSIMLNVYQDVDIGVAKLKRKFLKIVQ